MKVRVDRDGYGKVGRRKVFFGTSLAGALVTTTEQQIELSERSEGTLSKPDEDDAGE